MISILAASVLGSWTYAGFLTQPKPAPTPTPPSASSPIIPDRESAAPLVETRRDSPVPNPAPAPATKPMATPPPISPLSARYRLTDASGQTWEHADPAYLSSFIKALDHARSTYKSRP